MTLQEAVAVPCKGVSATKAASVNEENGAINGSSLLEVEQGFIVPDHNAFGNSFRDYLKESERKAGVEEFYRNHHLNQTFEVATKKKEEYSKLNRAEMSIWECFELLNHFVDASDPDLDEPQIEHLLQTAEAIRKDYPNEDWLHLTALIHVNSPLAAASKIWRAASMVTPITHRKFLEVNPDSSNPVYSTKLGIYKENCGLENVTMTWGHDEYMYLVAKENKTTLPPVALYIIRFHSFASLYTHGAYTSLMDDKDKEMLEWLKIFAWVAQYHIQIF
ncbi:hypothetical protein H6P81_001403 [Aristolochia fimbriata]|uniref:Inositol oxygenase n=1 Tax=Aristolochia fimbriata TaxID=158543 RepID=A0AAV7F9G6_ARIFI|nr:hypothetical protein H6P81_001403 [Aristolochia fimbriata]